ncbi:putative membrane protein [Frigoribacterium sp. PhB160]|uniref:DoxX family protein n=1 Tax=Frigoribacterium sp. PhB160 TaxID=2485192 RepID=UPI000F46E288|nr:DoxX family membrane protein [Frigoribacterium sp. PhB160]ROS59251.1 putative membrane protein [Frigoribacterium sp. PhB160]
MSYQNRPLPRTSLPRTIARVALGAALVYAGTSHLTFARESFAAQVPEFVPLSEDATVLASGVVEISLGAALIALGKRRVTVGFVAAAFFVAIFPGNIAQLVHHRDAFGLDTDTKRALRLVGQPLLIAWALWSTAALRDRRKA